MGIFVRFGLVGLGCYDGLLREHGLGLGLGVKVEVVVEGILLAEVIKISFEVGVKIS